MIRKRSISSSLIHGRTDMEMKDTYLPQMNTNPEDAMNVFDFLELQYNDCEVLEVDSTGNGIPKNNSSSMDQVDDFDGYLSKLLTSNSSESVPSPPSARRLKRKQEYKQGKTIPVEFAFSDGHGSDGMQNSTVTVQNWDQSASVGRRKDETHLYMMNPDDFPNDVEMQRRIRRSKISTWHRLHTKQYILEKTKEVRDLRKLNDNLQAKIYELIECKCDRSRSLTVDTSEGLNRRIVKVPTLGPSFRANTGEPLPFSSPSSSTSSTKTRNGKVLNKRPLASAFENSANQIPGNKPLKPIFNVAENKFVKSPGGITFQSPFLSADSNGLKNSSLNFLSQLRVSQEQKIQNVVGSKKGMEEMGPWKYSSPTSTGLTNPNQFPATSPTISKQFSGIYKREKY